MQLTRNHWIEAALQTLGRRGVDAVRVEVLARELGVTKGSFYWHFKDRNDLLESMISAWEEETRVLQEEAAKAGDAAARLHRGNELINQQKGHLPDYAMFAWARRDPVVAQRVVAVEARRLEFLRDIALEAGHDKGEAERLSMLGYLAFIGWVDRASRAPEGTPSFPAFSVSLERLIFPGSARSQRLTRAAPPRQTAGPNRRPRA
jgi:AcrR family transcriptional regulator